MPALAARVLCSLTVVFLNYTTMQMTAKIVYYGPGLCGKTTNLQFIHKKTAPGSRGEMVSLETEADRTLFFDLLPLDVGVIGGMKVRLQLYTVPGQVFYDATRKLVLKGVDGIVFVADSQVAMLDANVESFSNMETNLRELGLAAGTDVPLVLQYNKRDIRNTLSIEELDQNLNPQGRFPKFEAAALHGIGVFETLKGISKEVISGIRARAQADRKPAVARPAVPAPPPPAVAPTAVVAPVPSVRPAPAPPAAPVPAPGPVPAAARTHQAPAPPVADPLGHLLGDVGVEFAEEDTDKHLRVVQTRPQLDIHDELEKLRSLAAGKAKAPAPRRSPEVQLDDVLRGPERTEIRRRASVTLPAEVLARATNVRVELVFETPGGEERVAPLEVRLTPAPRARLQLDLAIEAKPGE